MIVLSIGSAPRPRLRDAALVDRNDAMPTLHPVRIADELPETRALFTV